MTVREFVEETFMRRLMDTTRDTRVVGDEEFTHLLGVLEPLMVGLAKKTVLPGLTEADLLSFYTMKIHQVLRRDRFDRTKNPRTLFGIALTNLNRDIKKVVDYARRQRLDEDMMDAVIELPNVDEYDEIDPAEQHELDLIMESLDDHERQIVTWAIEYVEQRNYVLVPLSQAIISEAQRRNGG